MESLEEKIARVVKEEVAVVPYDPCRPVMFEQERQHGSLYGSVSSFYSIRRLESWQAR